MTNIATTPNAVDYLKFCAAEVKSRLDYVADRLGQVDADYPLSEDEIEAMQSVLEEVQRTVIEAAAAFCGDGRGMDTYADGRRVETCLEIERGNHFHYRWHPQPDHPDNQPHTVMERHECTSGNRRTILVAGPQVLDSVDHGPGLRLVTDDGCDE